MGKLFESAFCVCFVLLCLKIKGNHLQSNCESGYLSCDKDSQCIRQKYWCDGGKDCSDGSDEKYCALGRTSTCNSNLHFKCNSDRCIPKSGRCDGYDSCPDGSDETFCDICPNHMFYCQQGECVKADEKCDGARYCSNGLDEIECEKFLFSDTYIGSTKRNAIDWLKSQNSSEFGWKKNTHRAIVALHLAGGANFQKYDKDVDLMAKQLELQMSTALSSRESQEITVTQLSMFINSLLVICRNPYNFYGINLVAILEEKVKEATGYMHPMPYLTLCSAQNGELKEDVTRLLQLLETSANYGFILEIQATAILALTCILKGNDPANLQSKVTAALNMLKKEQLPDGSFGSEYTTALVIQALIANDEMIDESWELRSGINFLKRAQTAVGSFGNFLTTYLVLPILNRKSLVDVSKVDCYRSPRRKNAGDMGYLFFERVSAKYSVIVGDKKDQTHFISLRIPKYSTVLELMAIAADADSIYKYKTHKIKGKNFIYEILSIPNDPEDSKFWFIYKDTDNGTNMMSDQRPDKVTVRENDHIVMWYKTPDFL